MTMPTTSTPARRRRRAAPTFEKSITLASGGTLTLSSTVGLFDLQGAERELVHKLADLVREYEGKRE